LPGFPYHGQPGYNVLVAESGVPMTNLMLPPSPMESTWAGDYHGDYASFWQPPERQPYFIHWAGGKPNGLRPIDELFARNLTPAERALWHSRVAARLPPNLRERARAVVRAARRAWRGKFSDFFAWPQLFAFLAWIFSRVTVAEAVAAARAGGLVMAPSGPGLAELPDDADYRAALAAADLRLLDSGLLAWLWEARHHRKLDRISGYLFLQEFLQIPEMSNPSASLWVAPTDAAAARTRAWLAERRGLVSPTGCWHVAPVYPRTPVRDETLLTWCARSGHASSSSEWAADRRRSSARG